MSDKTVQDLLNKSIKEDVAKQQQNKIQKLQEKVKDIEQNESAQISDKKYLKDLKHQWNELFIETVKGQSDIRNPLSLLAHNQITASQFIRRGLYPF